MSTHAETSSFLAPACALLAIVMPVHGGVVAVRNLFLLKGQEFTQTSPSTVNLLPANERPFYFAADVDGDNLASIAKLSPAPKIQLPGNSTFSTRFTTPCLGLGKNSDDGWNFGYVGKKVFDNWRTKTKGDLDSLFPNGNYIFTVQGHVINLSLPKDAYSSAPILALSGGTWSGGAYHIQINKPLTINSGTYAKYGTHMNDYIALNMWDDTVGGDLFDFTQVAKKLAGGPPPSSSKYYSRRVPANSLKADHVYYISSAFGAVVSLSTSLSGCLSASSFESFTHVKVVVTAVP